MKSVISILIFISLIFASVTNGAMDVGMGTTSLTSGRLVPALTVSVEYSNLWINFSATGTASKLTYFSGYTASCYLQSKMGTFLKGDLYAGIGGGAFFTMRGLRETTESDVEEVSDFGAGPGFKIVWMTVGSLFVNMEAIYGVTAKPYNLILLSTQDVIIFSMGWRF